MSTFQLIFDATLDYFREDVVRLFYLVGGGGGVMYWIDRWRGRTRLRITLEDEITTELHGKPVFRFEIVNLGGRNTSINKRVDFAGIDPVQSNKTFILEAAGDEGRKLKPHTPTIIEVDSNDEIPSLHFRRFRFRTSDGKSAVYRDYHYKNPSNSRLFFHGRRLMFLCFGKLF